MAFQKLTPLLPFVVLAIFLLVSVNSMPAEDAAQAAAAAVDAVPAASAPVASSASSANAPQEAGKTDLVTQAPSTASADGTSSNEAAGNSSDTGAPVVSTGKGLSTSLTDVPQNFAANVISQPLFLLAMIICAISMRSFA